MIMVIAQSCTADEISYIIIPLASLPLHLLLITSLFLQLHPILTVNAPVLHCGSGSAGKFALKKLLAWMDRSCVVKQISRCSSATNCLIKDEL